MISIAYIGIKHFVYENIFSLYQRQIQVYTLCYENVTFSHAKFMNFGNLMGQNSSDITRYIQGSSFIILSKQSPECTTMEWRTISLHLPHPNGQIPPIHLVQIRKVSSTYPIQHSQHLLSVQIRNRRKFHANIEVGESVGF